jgi:hypothetical protein
MHWLWVVVLAGCGRVGFEPLANASGDGGSGDGGTSDTALSPDAIQCLAGYTPIDGSCYRVQESPALTWAGAEAACEADGVGAHLVVPIDLAEVRLIQIDVLGVTVADAWIGISDQIVAGTHRAVTGDIAVTLWDPGQPDGGTERCVDIGAGAGADMKDSACTDVNDFICEYDGVPADPAAF